MVDLTSSLGEVSVEVKANLDQLVRDFAKGRQMSDQFDRSMGKTTQATDRLNRSTMKLEQEYRQLARSYDPLHAKAIRYQEDLIVIARLERAGMLDAQRAAIWRQNAARQSTAAAAGFAGVGRSAGLATGLIGGFVTAVGIGLVTKLSDVAMTSLKATAAIDDLSQAVGQTSTEFQEWRGIATMLGIEQQKMDSAMSEFAENVRQAAAGAEREGKAFQLLGVNLKDAEGNARPLNDILLNTIDRLREVGDPLQRGAALALLFGEAAGPQMAKLVDAGTGKIEELRKAVHETGMVLSEEQIQKADDTARKLEQVKEVLNAKIASTVVDNADAISDLADALAEVAGIAIEAAGKLAQFYKVASQPMPQAGGRSLFGSIFGMATNPAGTIARMGGDMLRGGGSRVTVGLRTVKPGTYYDPTDFSLLGKTEPKGGGIDLSSLFDRSRGRGRGGGRGRQAPDNIFAREEVQAQQERLRLLKASAVDLEKINEFEHALIDLKLKENLIQIDKQQKDGRLTATQAKELKAAEESNAQLEREAADREMRSGIIEQRSRLASEILDAERDGLDASLGLARTAEERTRIDAALLRNKQDQELLEIDKQIALAKEVNDQKRIAELVDLRRRLLEKQTSETTSFAVDQLRGIEKFRNELPKTVAEINEAIEDIRFDLFNERLQDAANFARDVGDAFGNAAGRIANFENPLSVLRGLLQDLSATLTQQFVVKPVSDWATKNIGLPLAKETMGRGLVGPDALTVEQMNLALNLATQNLNALSSAAMAASASMGGGGAGASQAASALGQAATSTEQSFSSLDPQLAQFGSGLMSILSGLGGGGGLAGFLKMGLSIAGSAFGGGGGGASAGGGTPLFTPSNPGVGFADGGWIGGHGTGRSDSMWIRGSRGEHMTNAMAAGKFGPVLDGINSGRIPDMAALAGMMAGQRVWSPSFHFGNLSFPHIRDAREARRASRQAASDLQRELSKGLRAGYRQSQ